MNNEYRVMVVQSEKKCDEEIQKILDTFLKSIKAKNGEARVVYKGSEEKYVRAVENILQLTK